MRKLAGGAALLAGLAVLAIAAAALATPNLNFSTAQISKGLFGEIDVKSNDAGSHQVKLKTKGDSDVYVVENTVAPGGHSGATARPRPMRTDGGRTSSALRAGASHQFLRASKA